MKKLVPLLICLMLILGSFAGCAQSTVTTDAKETTVKATDASVETTQSEVVELNFLIMPDLEVLQPTIDLFEAQNPNIKINLEVLPFDKMFEAIDVRLSAGEKDIDALLVDIPIIANYAVKGYLTEMDSYIDPNAKNRMTTASIDACTYNGSLMALPMYSSCVNLYYNKDLFEAKGVTAPENDTAKRWTWEQVVEVAKQLTYKQDGKQIYGLTFEQINRPYQLLPLGQSLGADKLVSDDGLTTTGFTNSAAMVQGAQFYYDTFNTWGISPKIAADQSVNYFTSGQVAMFVGGPWQIPAMQAANMNFGFAPHPYFEGGKVATPTGSWCVGVSNYSEHKAEAAKFVEFFASNDEACQMNFDIIKNLPSNLAVLENINKDSKYDVFPDNVTKLAVYEAINTAFPRPQLAGYAEWQAIMETAYSDIMNGADPQDALDKAVAEIDKQLAKYKQ